MDIIHGPIKHLLALPLLGLLRSSLVEKLGVLFVNFYTLISQNVYGHKSIRQLTEHYSKGPVK